MNSWLYAALLYLQFTINSGVRLHTFFQYIEGAKSDHKLQGFLHVGNDYAVFLRKPKANDQYLIYELYESKNIPEPTKYKPKLLAISKVPLVYLKEQLKIFKKELYTAKYVNNETIPGTQVKTLREWQLNRALKVVKKPLSQKNNVLRALVL